MKEYKRLLKSEGSHEKAKEVMLGRDPVLLERVGRSKVRLYETDRLKYYFAIVELDSAKTAKTLCA